MNQSCFHLLTIFSLFVSLPSIQSVLPHLEKEIIINNLNKSFKDISIYRFIKMELENFVNLLKTNLVEGLKLLDKLAIENDIEIWKKIDGYDYEVSSKGRVRNIKTGRILKPVINSESYYFVNLWKNGKGKSFRIHRLVAIAFLDNPENKKNVDHINNDRLDNNVKNLRFASSQENSRNRQLSNRNTSGIKGVHWHKRYKKWHAQIKLNGKKIHIGYFNSLDEAKTARQNKAKNIFGEFTNACEK